MAERSGTIAAALFLMPSICVISIRYGLPTVNEVISNDIIIELGIHSLALLIGIFMYVKYGVVEDHEYHRSAIIKRLSKSYSQEDKGLWDKSDNAILKLEENAKSSVKGRKGQLVQAKMSGNIGSLNVESSEIEVEEDLDIDSLGIVEVVMAFEDEFEIEIDDEELTDVGTVGQAVNLLHSKI